MNSVGNLGQVKKNVDLFNSSGYNIQKISWEDCARDKNSCIGPNISDMTLITKDGKLMPMIRKPNFSDVSHDINIDKFNLPTNKKGIVGLKDFLENIGEYANNDKLGSMYLDRDEKILTQNQCCILPCNVNDRVEFGVQLYNYQSSRDNPAVLTILVSNKGTSVQIIENKTILYHNNSGSAHYYKAKRLGDVREERGAKTNEAVKDFKQMTDTELLENTLMIIQIPLLYTKPERNKMKYENLTLGELSSTFHIDGNPHKISKSCSKGVSKNYNALNNSKDNFDMGNISVGSYASKYLGTKDSKFERDEKYPIRCTYQYYRLSDTSTLSEDSIQNITEQLNNIGSLSESYGSLVHSTTDRVTEPTPTEPRWGLKKMIGL